MPAFAHTKSSPPNLSNAASKAPDSDSHEDTSTFMKTAPGMDAAAAAPASSLLSSSTNFQSFLVAARCWATASPMPEAPPVMRATFPIFA